MLPAASTLGRWRRTNGKKYLERIVSHFAVQETSKEACAHVCNYVYLDDQGPVVRSSATEPILESSPMFIPVLLLLGKQLGVKHGGVAQLGVIASRKNPPGKFRLVDHRGDDILGRSNGLVKVKRCEFFGREGVFGPTLCGQGNVALLDFFFDLC